MMVALCMGSTATSLKDVTHALVSPSAETSTLVVALRLPRVLLGALLGAALGVSGAAMQGLFRNPLVDPGLLGVSAGAALGTVCLIVVGVGFLQGPLALSLAAFAGAALSMALVQAVSRAMRTRGPSATLLAGIGINALISALIGLLVMHANNMQLRRYTFWQFGSLGDADWIRVGVAAPLCLVAILALWRLSGSLNVMLLGDEEAQHLGVNVRRTRAAVVAWVALAVGSSVAVAGNIGFVGLLVPHGARLLVGADLRRSLPLAALVGALLLVLADALARSATAPLEIPLGVITSVVGAPVFLALLVLQPRRAP